jgi:hypothetical protein
VAGFYKRDALIYASAILHRATIYTQEAHFEDLPQVRYFSKPASDNIRKN